jgi:hypothetical protein
MQTPSRFLTVKNLAEQALKFVVNGLIPSAVIAKTQGQFQCMVKNLNKKGKTIGMAINRLWCLEKRNRIALVWSKSVNVGGVMITADGKDDK